MQLTILYLTPTTLHFVLVKRDISTMETVALHVALHLLMLVSLVPLRVCVSVVQPTLHLPMVIVCAKANSTATTQVPV